jgi:DNA-binding MarR family transcriptional regulator
MMESDLIDLGRAFEKYLSVNKMPLDFGVGEPLYPSEIHMISTVARKGVVNVTELARHLGKTKGAASQMVGKLVKKGLLSKSPDPEKKSRILVAATDKGRVAHEAHMEFHAAHDRLFIDYLAELAPEEYRTFSTLCRRMNAWMDSYLTRFRKETTQGED